MERPTTAQQLQGMIGVLGRALVEADAFDGGNKNAGTRLRKTMQEVRALCKAARDTVIEVREARQARRKARKV